MHHTPKIRINLQTGYNNRHEYNIKDHLGNTRVCFTPPTDNTTTPWIIQQTNYYAYGLPIKNLTTTYNTPLVGGTPSLVNRYQYNGKEFETDLGIMWNDYGARWYDPQLGRWWQIDPLAEKYYGWSGYNYVMGNPIRNIDPDGRTAEAAIVGNKVVIRANITFYGSGASLELAEQQAKQIQNDWNAAGGKVSIGKKQYNVVFEVTGSYDEGDSNGPSNLQYEIATNTDYKQNYIRIEKNTDSSDNTSYVDKREGKSGGNTGFWKSAQLFKGAGNSGIHEFGHQLGLSHPADNTSCCIGPSIMLTEPNNRQVDTKYTKTLNDGTKVFDVSKRKVTKKDIKNIGLPKLNFVNGKANIGSLTNIYHKPAKK